MIKFKSLRPPKTHTGGELPIVSRDPHNLANDPDFEEEFEAFSCKVPAESPATPDRVTPDVRMRREFFGNLDLFMPDGTKVRMWGFFDPRVRNKGVFPNDIIRVTEGQIVLNTVHVRKNVHTIHHHAIEPTTFNDGVGHTSFEIQSRYTYQWQGNQAGTYFYHCHVNTTLHFEMGMYGFLVVDPPVPDNPDPRARGFVRRVDDIVPFHVEAFWAADEFDPVWHEFKHAEGLKCPNGEDSGLNDFNPRFFLITGVASPLTLTDPRVAIDAKVGDTILIRILNAGYTIQRFTIGLDAEVIEIDGRPLGQSPHSPYSRPFTIQANTPFELTTAQRWSVLIKPTESGTFPARVEYLQWINRTLFHTAETVINVKPATAENGKIAGYVTNRKGKPIRDADLTMKGKKTGTKMETTCNEHGFFEFTDLWEDTYTIVTRKRGYETHKHKEGLKKDEVKMMNMKMKRQ